MIQYSKKKNEWQLLPFGITPATSAFQRLMNNLFRQEIVDIYVDDIIIMGKTFQEHLDNINTVGSSEKPTISYA